MKRSYPMHCLIRSNVGDVKMTDTTYRTDIMRILGHKIFVRKLKINFMSTRKGSVEYSIAQEDKKRRHQKCDFHCSTSL